MRTGQTVAVVSLGGASGAVLRYLLDLAWPTAPGAFPTTTLVINVLGCVAIGVLLVMVTEVWTRHRMLRPFLATGVLGGFTTFSTYAVDVHTLTTSGRVPTGLLYLVATPLCALCAVWLTAAGTRKLVTRRLR